MSLSKGERRGQTMPEATWPEERMERAFRDQFRDFFSGGPLMERLFEGRAGMRMEEFIEDGTGVVRAELPGIDPDKDLEISVADGILRIKAQREERKEDKRPGSYRSEFQYGSMQRSIRLPEGATESDIHASYKDGILEVRFPMPAPVGKEPTKIAIERS